MTDINFQPIFDYLDNQFKQSLMTEIRDEFNGKFNVVQISIDAVLKEVVAMRQEWATMHHRFNRLEDWAKPAGNKIELPFNM